MHNFKAFGMINLQYGKKNGKKFLLKPQMTKISQDNNGIIISIISIKAFDMINLQYEIKIW